MENVKKKPLALAMGKIFIALAWADGKVQEEEIKTLKDYLFRLPMLSERDWASLNIYMEYPVTEEEREFLISEFKLHLSDPQDREFALEGLTRMVLADGKVTKAEERMLRDMRTSMMVAKLGFASNVIRMLRKIFQKRRKLMSNVANREVHLDEYMENQVLFRVKHFMRETNLKWQHDAGWLERVCLMGGLMARMVMIDRILLPEEAREMINLLMQRWNLTREWAETVTMLSLCKEASEMDVRRLAVRFEQTTTDFERRELFQALVQIVKADSEIDPREVKELERMAEFLKVDVDFMNRLLLHNPAAGDFDSGSRTSALPPPSQPDVAAPLA